MKSGKDLWNGFTGWVESSSSTSSDWTDVRMGKTSLVSRSMSLAISDGGSGFTRRTTAPMTV